jgi:cathepsin X
VYSCGEDPNAKIFSISEYGTLSGELSMMNEIYQRGPITCEISSSDGEGRYIRGMFIGDTRSKSLSTNCSITGWGEENGTKY